MCFGFTNDIPKTIEEFDLMTRMLTYKVHLGEMIMLENSNCIHSVVKEKGGGKLIVKKHLKNKEIKSLK